VQVEPEEWTTLSRLLDEALDVSLEARERWLETLPPAHASYKEKLRALLRHDVGSETKSFRDIFPHIAMGDAVPAVVHRAAGTRIGPYVLEEEIGQGGMGVVWRARRSDGSLKRAVALKLPHVELYGHELNAHFESERDILAELVHPNIARLYDAGVSKGGQPYLAIEYVAGCPLTEYCDRERLDVSQRLRLFQQVLGAVQYAHRHLVIHRDLKPTNVIVGPDGRAMLLDFGIAKLIAVDNAERESGGGCAALTPDYASPEQVLGKGITTSSDIYSLGVLLFELLTGSRPYQVPRHSRGALEEAILNCQPRRPSESVQDEGAARALSITPRALARLLQGDLDAIVLKALKKESAERYGTADAFMSDVECYLRGQAIEARAGSRWYRTRKFVSRYAVPLAAGSAAATALIATTTVALSQAHTAAMERDRAVTLSSRSEAVAGFLEMLISEAGSAGKPVTVTEMVSRSEALAKTEYRDRPEQRAAILAMLGSHYHTTGKEFRAEALLREALEAVRDSGDLALRSRIACMHAGVISAIGRTQEAERTLRAIIADPQTPNAQSAMCLYHLAMLKPDDGNVADALKFSRLALARLRQEPHSEVTEATLLAGVAYAESISGHTARAERMYRDALALLTHAGRDSGSEAFAIRTGWATVSYATGNPKRALQLLEDTTERSSRADGSVPPPLYLLTNRARVLEVLGRYEQSRTVYLECLPRALQESTFDYMYCLTGAASTSAQLGELATAQVYVRQANSLLNSFSPDSTRTLSLRGVRALIAMKAGRLTDARAELDFPFDEGKDLTLVRNLLLMRAEINLLDGRPASAESDARHALALARRAQGQARWSNNTGLASLMLGRALAEQGHGRDARRALETAVANLSQTVDDRHPMLLLARGLVQNGERTPLVAQR
jgi:serine/threonine-protein kinase